MSDDHFLLDALTLEQGIEETRRTLRDEHFPYESGRSVYSALHEILNLMDHQAEAFVAHGRYFPGQAPEPAHLDRFRLMQQMLKTIKETLG